jgi:hypothetical protein
MVKKTERILGANTLPFSPSALRQFCYLAACQSSLENTWKMNFKPILNKTSPWAHTKSELDMLCVPKKLVKYVVYSSKRRFWKRIFFFTQAVQIAINQFLVSRNLSKASTWAWSREQGAGKKKVGSRNWHQISIKNKKIKVDFFRIFIFSENFDLLSWVQENLQLLEMEEIQ